MICDITTPKDSNVPSNAQLVNTGSSFETSWGVSTTGALFFGALSMNLVDPYYPDIYGSVTNKTDALEKTDWCLAHPEENGAYHYHIASPCLANSSLGLT